MQASANADRLPGEWAAEMRTNSEAPTTKQPLEKRFANKNVKRLLARRPRGERGLKPAATMRAGVLEMCSSLRAGRDATDNSRFEAALTMPCGRPRAFSCPPDLDAEATSRRRRVVLCGRRGDPLYRFSEPKVRRFDTRRSGSLSEDTDQGAGSSAANGKVDTLVTVKIGDLERTFDKSKLDSSSTVPRPHSLDSFNASGTTEVAWHSTPAGLWKAARTRQRGRDEVLEGYAFSRHTASTLPDTGLALDEDSWTGQPISNDIADIISRTNKSSRASALICRKRQEARHRDHVGFPVDPIDHVLKNTVVPNHPRRRAYRKHGQW